MAKWGRDFSTSFSQRQRLIWLAIGGGLLWLVIVGRLLTIQIIRHDQYLKQARSQHERRLELKGHRGRLLDRHGRVLAVDVQAYTYFADPAEVDEPAAVARHFAPLGGYSVEALERQLRGKGHFVYLARQLDDEALLQAEERKFQGVFRYPETKRYYPQGYLAGQVIGYTNIDNKGSEGVELAFEELLRPTSGTVLYKVNALGEQVPGSREERKSPEDGQSVLLTLDAVYQDIFEQELEEAVQSVGAESGRGIISDPRTGEILAMVNVPLYDPNDPGKVEAQFRRNRTITDPYEPGSTFKVVTASAILNEGLATPEEMMFCENGRLELGHGQVIRDHEPYGWLSFAEVIEHSSNIGTLKFARRLSRARFYEYIRKFGFAARSNVGLPAESAGLLKEVGQWSARSLETLAIGQEISVTPLQLVQAVGAIANGGLLMAPLIVKGILRPDGQVEELAKPQPIRRVVSPATAATMRRILTSAVERGTGKKAQILGVAVAGKTGTAQRALPNGRGYAPGETVVSFVGFLPAEAPEILCLVVIENPKRDKWGGTLAAPVFQRVMERILYLPGQRPLPLQQQVDSEAAPVVTIPDLRGLSQRTARFQAGLRGLPVTFSGEGEVVVEQIPAPGDSCEGLLQIACVLGTPGAVGAVGPEDSLAGNSLGKAASVGDSLRPLRRQMRLLQLLSNSAGRASVEEL